MATLNKVKAVSATLGAGVADTITLSDSDIKRIRVILRSGTGPLTVTWNPGSALVLTPTSLGDNCYVVPSTSVPLDIWLGKAAGQSGVTIGVISATADAYTVEGHTHILGR